MHRVIPSNIMLLLIGNLPHPDVILAPASSLIIGSFISHAGEVWGCGQIQYIDSLHAR